MKTIQFYLTPAAGKRLIAKGIAAMADVRAALLAGTVVIDISSQKIFENTEDLIAYTKRIHAEQVKRQNS